MRLPDPAGLADVLAVLGPVVRFRGVAFQDGWEFGLPCVLYSPFRRYSSEDHSPHGVDRLVEDVLEELYLGRSVPVGFSPCDLHEFGWRGWSPGGFRRRRGVLVRVEVRLRPDSYRVLRRTEEHPRARPAPRVLRYRKTGED